MLTIYMSCVLVCLSSQNPGIVDEYKALEELCNGGQAEAQKALDLLNKMEARYRQNDSRMLYIRWKRGVCLLKLGDSACAQTTFCEAIDKAPDGHGFLVFVYRDSGESYLHARLARKAQPLLEKALAFAAKPGKFEGFEIPVQEIEMVRIDIEIAECKVILADKAARNHLEQLEKKIQCGIKREAEPAEVWRQLNALCQLQLAELDRLMDIERGNERLESALKILQLDNSAESVNLQIKCHINVAMNLWRLARFKEADKRLGIAGALVAKLPKNPLWETRAARNAAAIDEYRGALSLEQCILTFELHPENPDLPDQLKVAEKFITSALKQHEKAGNPTVQVATNIFNRGQLYELRGRMCDAAGRLQEAANEFTKAKNDCEKALQLVMTAFDADDDYPLEIRRKRAWVLLRLGQPADIAEARTEATAILEMFKKKHDKDDVDAGMYYHLQLAIEARDHKWDKAAEHAANHRQLVTKGLLARAAGLTAPELIQYFQKWDDPALQASLRLGIEHPELGDQSAEWMINGKGKLIEALAHVHLRDKPEAAKDYQEFLRSVQRQAYSLYGRPGRDAEEVQADLLREEANKRNLAARYAISDGTWKSLTNFRRGLTKDEVFVGIYCLRSKEGRAKAYYAWIVTAEDKDPARIIELPESERIDKLVQEFSTYQRDFLKKDVGDFHKEGVGLKGGELNLRRTCLKPLSDLLMKPILPFAGCRKRWIISPDGLLWNIPWAALSHPDDDTKYAIEDFTFRYVFSGREIGQEPAKALVDAPLVLYDADFDHVPPGWKNPPRRKEQDKASLYFKRLSGTRDEGVKIETELKALFPGVKPTVLTNDKACKEALMGLKQSPRMIHLATHSLFLNRSELQVDDPLLYCAIAFAGWNVIPNDMAPLPGLLTAPEIVALPLSGTELVVLSSCQSGVGVLDVGQRSADLRHAFHLAGSRAVVSCLWNAADKDTGELMVAFYEEINRRGLRAKVDALREAQLRKIKADRKYLGVAHPFYWAGFTLSGS